MPVSFVRASRIVSFVGPVPAMVVGDRLMVTICVMVAIVALLGFRIAMVAMIRMLMTMTPRRGLILRMVDDWTHPMRVLRGQVSVLVLAARSGAYHA